MTSTIITTTLLIVCGIMPTYAMIEDLILHQEKTGIILQGDGVVIPNARPYLMSTFLRLKNPAKLDACQYTCRIQSQDIWALLTLEKCESTLDKIGDKTDIIKTIDYDIDTSQSQHIPATECFKECLKIDECIAFGLEATETKHTCIIRNHIPLYYKTSPNSTEYDMRCMVTDKQAFCRNRMTKMDTLFEKTNNNFVNKTIDTIHQLLNLTKQDNTPGKRQVEILGAGFVIGSLLTGAFSIYEQSKINSHLNEFYDEFQKFRDDVTDYMDTATTFHRGMLKLYQELETNIKHSIQEIDCEMSSISRFTLTQNLLQQWKDYMDNIAKDLVNGQFRGTISPVIFDKEDIINLLDKNNLRDTIYSQNIPLFYRLGRMWLIDITRDGHFFHLHLLISIPNIRSDEMNVLYQVNHVGLVNNTSCTRLNVPNKVYKQNGLFYQLDNENNCETRGDIKLCLGQNTSQSQMRLAPCLNGNHNHCNVRQEMCTLEYIQTGAGVMTRALKHIKASTKTSPNHYIDIANTSAVKYIDYNNYYQIVIDNFIVHSLDEPIFSKELELPNPNDWDDYLKDQSITFNKTNVSSLRDNLERQSQIIEDIKSSTLNLDFTKSLTLANVGLIILTLTSLILVFCIYKCMCNKNKDKNNDKCNDKDIEMESNYEDKDTKSSESKSSVLDKPRIDLTTMPISASTKQKSNEHTAAVQKSEKIKAPVAKSTNETTMPPPETSGLRNRASSTHKRAGPVTVEQLTKTA